MSAGQSKQKSNAKDLSAPDVGALANGRLSLSEFDFLVDLGRYDAQEKEAKKEKAGLKERFFELATEKLAKEPLAERYASLPASSEEEACDRFAQYYAGYTLDAIRPVEGQEGQWEAILIEDPALKSFSVEVAGRVYSRQIRSGSPLLDDERLQEDDPELYEAVTELKRVVKPLESLDDDTLAKLSNYIYVGRPTVALPAPKKAKD